MSAQHSDPCCCKDGCRCRLDATGQCKICAAKLARDRESEWFGTFLVGAHKGGPDLEIIEFVRDPSTHRGSHTECLALDGTIVNSPEIRHNAPSFLGCGLHDTSWAL